MRPEEAAGAGLNVEKVKLGVVPSKVVGVHLGVTDENVDAAGSQYMSESASW